jgi:hypothetical protein
MTAGALPHALMRAKRSATVIDMEVQDIATGQ